MMAGDTAETFKYTGTFHMVLFILRCITPVRNVHDMIRTKYGAGTLKSIRHVEKSRKTVCKLDNDIFFLQRCYDNNMLPRFLSNTNCPIRRVQGSRLHRKHQRDYLLEELTEKRRDLRIRQRSLLTSPNIDSLGCLGLTGYEPTGPCPVV